MRKLPFRNITLWLTILTLLWSSQGYGYVWCMTEEGTHLENLSASHCVLNDAVAASRLETFAVGDACGPCVDLAATHDTLQYRTDTGCDLDTHFLPSTIVRPQWAPPVFVRYLSNNLILEPSSRISMPLLVHRSTVLLI